MEELIAGLDVGSSTVRVAAGEGVPQGGISITGIGTAPSRGICRGMVADIEAAAVSIAEAVSSAERQAGKKIRGVAAGFTGEHILGINASGVTLVGEGRIRSSDIDRAIDNAENSAVPAGMEIIHAIPSGYRIDEQRDIKEPSGMAARHLEAMVHFIASAENPYENFMSCIRSAGCEVECPVFQPLASVHSCLSRDENEAGAILVDMGSGTTEVVAVSEGAVRFSRVIPFAGDSITSDIALCLEISRAAAEKIKQRCGRASADEAPGGKITLPGSGKTVTAGCIAEIIEARLEEIFEFVLEEMRKAGSLPAAGAGLVLTGGGAVLEGIRQKAERFFKMPVRIGKPEYNVSGLEKFAAGPFYSSAAGLAGLGAAETARRGGDFFSGPGVLGSINRKMKTWFRDII